MGRFLTRPWGSRSWLRISGQLRHARAAVTGVSGAQRVGTHFKVPSGFQRGQKSLEVGDGKPGSLFSPSETVSLAPQGLPSPGVAPHPFHQKDAPFVG